MRLVITYLLVLLVAVISSLLFLDLAGLPEFLSSFEILVKSVIVSCLGGILYCLRAVYLNRSVRNQWDKHWEVWYYLRPITSAICGAVAFLFLKAGLVVLDAAPNLDSGEYGYLAFAFLAGLNVDKFVLKVEDVGKSIFGIEKSRTAKESETKTKEQK